jgi:hypothetical protein
LVKFEGHFELFPRVYLTPGLKMRNENRLDPERKYSLSDKIDDNLEKLLFVIV